MGDTNTLEIYNAQVENVRKIESAKRILKKKINQSAVAGHSFEVQALTSLYLLIYSTWVEAEFLKLVHTPYGFSTSEIEQIVNNKNYGSLEEGFEKCLELAINKVSGWKKGADLPNHIQSIKRYFQDYILNKSQLRNKFSHGQWVKALNRDNNKVNQQITAEINAMTIIDIDKSFFVTQKLIAIIEFMIESPEKHYRGNYYQCVQEIEKYLQKSHSFNLSDKIQKLKQKKSHYTNQADGKK